MGFHFLKTPVHIQITDHDVFGTRFFFVGYFTILSAAMRDLQKVSALSILQLYFTDYKIKIYNVSI
jgi:hypothetical protein